MVFWLPGMVIVLPRPGILVARYGNCMYYQGLVFFITGIEINFGNNIGLAPSKIYACIAPVGGHTCLTAGERSEPAD